MDFIPILIGELISILATILIVDRVLAWRERRRWREVRELFMVKAKGAADTIIDTWETWLLSMSKTTLVKRVDEHDKTLLTNLGYFASWEKTETINLQAETYLGKPVGSNIKSLAIHGDSQEIDTMIRMAVPYLVTRLFPAGDPSWSRLQAGIDPSVKQLSDLIDRYSTVVDPKLALPVIRLSIELDNLTSGVYESAVEEPIGPVAVVTTIAEAIRQSLELQYHIRHTLRV
jgi:hypothetical protein